MKKAHSVCMNQQVRYIKEWFMPNDCNAIEGYITDISTEGIVFSSMNIEGSIKVSIDELYVSPKLKDDF